jgi:hypothetical protein
LYFACSPPCLLHYTVWPMSHKRLNHTDLQDTRLKSLPANWFSCFVPTVPTARCWYSILKQTINTSFHIIPKSLIIALPFYDNQCIRQSNVTCNQRLGHTLEPDVLDTGVTQTCEGHTPSLEAIMVWKNNLSFWGHLHCWFSFSRLCGCHSWAECLSEELNWSGKQRSKVLSNGKCTMWFRRRELSFRDHPVRHDENTQQMSPTPKSWRYRCTCILDSSH